MALHRETRATAMPEATASTAGAGSDLDACDLGEELGRVRGAVAPLRAPLGLTPGAIGTGFHIGGGRGMVGKRLTYEELIK